jgi:hypothetical protein
MKSFVLTVLFLAVGCAPTRKFDVTVHNNTPQTVMLWLTKDGPPAEKGWWTSEQFVAQPDGTPSPGIQLPPDKTADTGEVKGKFPQGTHAILLVYRTGPMAALPGGSEPLTIKLVPGKNELEVYDENGKLTAK